MPWRHKKRGTIYNILSNEASLQCSTDPEFENKFKDYKWTVYQDIASGKVYIRLTMEFMDGRFEKENEK